MKHSYIYLAMAAASFMTACSEKEEDQTPAPVTTTELVATINSAQQVPTNNSTATGTFAGTYDSSTDQMKYTITYQGITPTSMHIHVGGPGTGEGQVAIPLPKTASPITGTVPVTKDQATKLLSNGMYVNIHSSTYGLGEIRGISAKSKRMRVGGFGSEQ
ncbi:CHRD domain-containing protein [Hymenobacter cellulosilyticus]|uniref:CHRD domain-containing protein n=1 Tax=Hymenobacter cellulosilyticus TaxID=2932248 RepID=A0A8T9Q0B2_9BACT|nr:CHRD domain-containing protein [Hymenobacter cellulosilyticus]UOQ71206.1 CHRD domain-containing protein [Hymenobacter cellulosilyticus]